jgi:hypothetical protein
MHALTPVLCRPAWHRVSSARTRTLLASDTSGFVANDFGVGNLGAVAKRFMNPRPAPTIPRQHSHSHSKHIRGIVCARGGLSPAKKDIAKKREGAAGGGRRGRAAVGGGRGAGSGGGGGTARHALVHPLLKVAHPKGAASRRRRPRRALGRHARNNHTQQLSDHPARLDRLAARGRALLNEVRVSFSSEFP